TAYQSVCLSSNGAYHVLSLVLIMFMPYLWGFFKKKNLLVVFLMPFEYSNLSLDMVFSTSVDNAYRCYFSCLVDAYSF
ncbi:hypothetical protein ACJX0J_015857, partial [Zea mays]